MAVLTITADYDVNFWWDGSSSYNKRDGANFGYVGGGGKGSDFNRQALRFPLNDLPADANITQVRLYVYNRTAGGASHLTDIHAYGTNGQDNPYDDSAQTGWGRCASGNLYLDDSTDLRTTGDKWFTLGGNVITDVLAAKNAVNRFSLGLHEEGDNDTYAKIAVLEDNLYPAKLEITYTEAVATKRIICDGLVCIIS